MLWQWLQDSRSCAHCSHYHGPLADGVVAGKTVRCPWHHACFDLSSGEAVRAPALSSLACWKVERGSGRIFVKEKRAQVRHLEDSEGVSVFQLAANILGRK